MQRRELNDGTLEPLLLVGRRAAIPELARRGDVLADSGGRLIERRVEGNGRLLAGLAPTLRRHGGCHGAIGWTETGGRTKNKLGKRLGVRARAIAVNTYFLK